MKNDSAKNKKWQTNFDALATFNAEYGRWPGYDRNSPDTVESKLGNFASVQRKNYRNGSLEDQHFRQLLAIGFNFGGKEDNWQGKLAAMKELLAEKKSVSVDVIGDANYAWLRYNWKKYLEGELEVGHAVSIEELELQTFFPTWEEEFELIKAWVTERGKPPTRAAFSQGHSWLLSQRMRFKNGTLSADQIRKIRDIGFELEAKGIEKDADIWRNRFNEYKLFLVDKANGVVTKHPDSVYTWVQTQRAVFKGSMAGRNPLYQWKIEALNAIGFKWSQEEILAEQWTEKFRALKAFLTLNDLNALQKVGEATTHYRWLGNQQKKFKNGKLSKADFLRLSSIGFDACGVGVMHSFVENWRQLLFGAAKESSQSDFDDEVDRLNLLVATDQTGEAIRRMEHYQQQLHLFGDQDTAECAFCGLYFPRALMVAAHIKARSRCTEMERLDLNVVIPACRFGCDELFEKGYITVKEGLIIVSKDLPSSPALEQKLALLAGRRTPYFLEKRRKYFEAHREHHSTKN